MVPEPTDLRPLDGDLAPLLFALDSSLDGERDSLDATGDAAHTPTRSFGLCAGASAYLNAELTVMRGVQDLLAAT